MIRKVKKSDLIKLAPIYKKLYDNADIGEYWTEESSLKLLNYWYNRQKDLFFVAVDNGNVVGAVMSGVKPWFDGNRLIDTEIFIDTSCQHKHYAKRLYKKHFEEALNLKDWL